MSPSQHKLLGVISAYTQAQKRPPTITFMAKKYGIRTPSMWERYRKLAKQGFLKQRDRLYWPTGKASRVSPCPCCGHKEEQG